MSRVFAIQRHLTWSPTDGKMVERYDLSAASEYGSVHFLLTEKPSPEEVVEILRIRLAGYSDDDYLLLIGSPAYIGLATAVAAAENSGRVRLLQWDRRALRYRPFTFQLPTV